MSFRPAARQFFERRGAPTPHLPDVDSYAGFAEAWSFWDGIRNVGVSAPHDNSAQTWCDLARNDTTLAIAQSMSFGDKGLNTVYSEGVVFGGTNASNYFYTSETIPDMTSEVVVNLEELAPSPGASGGILGLQIGLSKLITYGAPYGVKYYVWALGQGNYAYNAAADIAPGLMSFVSVFQSSQSSCRLYINNSLKFTASGTVAAFSPDLRYNAKFNREFSYPYGLTGTYHRMSVVKRALTDAELTQNWQIDQTRFGGNS